MNFKSLKYLKEFDGIYKIIIIDIYIMQLCSLLQTVSLYHQFLLQIEL